MKELSGWKEFEESLIYQRYSIRHPETGERLEKTYEDIINRITEYVLRKTPRLQYPVGNKVIEEGLKFVLDRDIIFATPALMNLGNPYTKKKGYYSCFPLGPIPDSTSEILDYVALCADIFQHAGGVGLDFSELRKKNCGVDGNQGCSSGPVGFIPLFEATSKSIAAGGKRRGAMLGQLDWDHPDILDFVNLKRNHKNLWSINLSVNVSKGFWENKKLIKEIALGMWSSGDPGLLFPEEMAKNSPYPEYLKPLVKYVNPCGEFSAIPFLPCNLLTVNALSCKSINDFEELGFYATHLGNALLWITLSNEGDEGEGLPKGTKFSSRFLEVTSKQRPIGVGLSGLAEYLFRAGKKYNDTNTIKEIYLSLTRGSLRASSEWAAGTNQEAEWDPIYKRQHLAMIGLPENLKFWNTTTICQAPTGSVSQFLRCVSTGIEPLESFTVKRQYLNSDGKFQAVNLTSRVNQSGVELPPISPSDQLKVVSTIQSISHTSASKTINVSKETTVEEVEEIIWKAKEFKLKGLTIYRRGCSSRMIVDIDSKELQKQELKKQELPDVRGGNTFKFRGINNLYIIINELNNKPVELFVTAGKSGRVINGLVTGIGRLVSLVLKSGTSPKLVTKALEGIETGDFYTNSLVGRTNSICDAIGKTLHYREKVEKEDFTEKPSSNRDSKSEETLGEDFDSCPQCQNYTLARTGSCWNCNRCEYCTC